MGTGQVLVSMVCPAKALFCVARPKEHADGILVSDAVQRAWKQVVCHQARMVYTW